MLSNIQIHCYSSNSNKDSLNSAIISTMNDSMGYLLVPDKTENWVANDITKENHHK